MKNLVFAFLLLSTAGAVGQTNFYTTANAHAHNDYQHEPPLVSAYNNKFGSIEADVYFSDNELYVAHTEKDVNNKKKFEDVYVKPLVEYITSNHGYVYEDTTQSLVLMIDVKSEAGPAITKLIRIISKYPEITKCKSLMVLVSGNKPDPSSFINYPDFIWFDGLLSNRYKKEELDRIAILSDNFVNYTSWKGAGDPPAKDWAELQKAVTKGHELGKKVRLWNTPDNEEGWSKVLTLGVDYIDSYSIKALAEFLKKSQIPKAK